MANFMDDIKNICNDNAKNHAEKVEALIKIGLPWQEAQRTLMFAANGGYKEKAEAVYTFGIELECGVNHNAVIAENSMFYYAGYTHHDEREMFKFVTDASVSVQGGSIECVSPILTANEDGFGKAKKACDALNAKGAKVNKSCGYHVHIGAADMSDRQYINIFKNYQKIEKVIDTFMAKSRRANNACWCRSLRGLDFSNCTTKESVATVFGGGDWRGRARYYKVNAMAYTGHKTVEFRQHQGTTDATKVCNWVKFLLALVEYSKREEIKNEVNSIDEIPFLSDELKAYYKARKEQLA